MSKELSTLGSVIRTAFAGEADTNVLTDALLALLQGTYGILSAQANSTPEGTVDATPRKVTAWNTDGISNGVTVDHTSDDLTIVTTGVYLVSASVSFSGSNSKTFHIEIQKDASPTGFVLERKLGAGGDVGNSGVVGLVSLTAGEAISLYQHSTDGGTALTVREAELLVVRIA